MIKESAEMIKLVCIKEALNFKLDEIYDGRYFSYFYITSSDKNICSEKWAIEVVSGIQGYKTFLYLPIENFIRLSEWREKQINEIIDGEI